MNRFVVAIAATALAIVANVRAQSNPTPAPVVDTAVTSSCTIEGYLSDTDPKGTNVRSGPRADAPVIGRLPILPPHAEGSFDANAPEFDIIGSKNGWLLIRDARFDRPSAGVKKLFSGPGWISGALVSFTVGSNALLAGPSDDAKIIEKLSSADAGYGPDSFNVTRVHACQGHFAEVTIDLVSTTTKHAPMRGWVGHVCSNQLTTCGP